MAFATIAAALSSIKTATDIAKIIKDSDISLEKAETKQKFAELILSLADANLRIAEVQQFLIKKDEELKELNDKLKIKGEIHYEKPYYWLIDGSKKEGPYCQTCYDKDGALIRLQTHGTGYWMCMVCKNGYKDNNWTPPQQSRGPRAYRG